MSRHFFGSRSGSDSTAQSENDPLNARRDMPSFLVTDSPEELIVRFEWDGLASIGLELVRLKTAPFSHVIHWTGDSLGVTFGIEETSRRVIVTRTTRDDVRVGYQLVRAMGETVTESNFDERMAALKRAHEISRGIPFEFVSPPPPVYVKNCSGPLKQSGVDGTFELRFVAGQAIRYLSMEELHAMIRGAAKPLALTFVQRKDSQYLAALKKEANNDTVAASSLAAAAIIGVAIC
jgi:hypothetical protein